MTTSVLYRWPAAAHFGRSVPKNKFYQHGKIAASTREKFVAEVRRITWAYKLADSTIHLRGTEAVPEIQVFSLDAKDDDVSDAVLAAIDKAVHSPIIFEVNRGDDDRATTRMAATHKQLSSTKPHLTSYFSTAWVPQDVQRSPLPAAIDLPGLYTALLAPLLPVARAEGEQLSDMTARARNAQKLEREIGRVERRLRNEPQFNRKVELRRQLIDRIAALEDLTQSVQSIADDDRSKK